MDYKKIFKSQDMRFAILNALSWVPDNIMLPIQYRLKLGRWPNLKEPKRWTEKLQLYKMKYRNPVLSICVDKYEVRSYIKSKGLDRILVPLLGVYDRFDDIDFEKLPNSFVLKTTDGGGGLNVVIVDDKHSFRKETSKNEFDKWQKRFKPGAVNDGREWAYSGILKSRIVAEELLVNSSNPAAGVEDFKILCFAGNPQYIIVDKDRYINHKRNFYDINWNRVFVTTDHEQFEEFYPKPKNFESMLDVAKVLSSDFPFVRVDLYNIEGKIYFGELTFYPWTGYVQFNPDTFDFELGDCFDISF